MTSNPLMAARASVVARSPLRPGSSHPGVPFKSILRESTAAAAASQIAGHRPAKRKLDDRGDDSRRGGIADKRRRIAASDAEEEEEEEEEEEDDDDGDDDDDKKEPEQGEDANGEAARTTPSSPTKRAKTVHFDMTLNITTEAGRRTLDETKIAVRRALQKHAAVAAAAVAGRSARPGGGGGGVDGGDESDADQEYAELLDVFSHDMEAYRDPLRNGSGDGGDGDGRIRALGEADGAETGGNTVRPDDLVLYVVALTSCAPLLNRSCVDLVRKVLACSWLGRDDKFFRAYVQFLAALVSAQGAYLRPVLEMIVDWFKEPSAAAWTVPDFAPVSRATVQTRLHFGLRYLLRLFPAARTAVCKLVAQKFPFPAESKSVHMLYLDNLLRLREYAPSLGPDVLETITAQLVKIDTEFQLDLTDMDDDLVAKVVLELARKEHELNEKRAAAAAARAGAHAGRRKGLEEEDDEDEDDEDEDGNDADADANADANADADADDADDADSDDDSEADESDMPQFGDPDYDEEAARVDRSTKLVQKLDAILDRLFAVFTPVFANPDSAAARACLEDMLSDFANFVLTVPSSRHTQFLVFHFSQKSPALQDLFTGTLLNLGFESNRPAAVRQAAAAYLSSYVARAARVPRETVRSVAQILCHRIDGFRRRHAAACRGPDLRRYQELYVWVQALVYMFCFRWRDLVDGYPEALVDPEDAASFVGQDLEWMPGLRATLTEIIYAPFNPLMVCSPPIVAEFAKLAHSLRLMYVFPRIESNKGLHLAQFASGRYSRGDALREDAGYALDHDERWLQLEGNFPFDPYHLPVSKRWLEGDYVSWTPIPGLGGGAAGGDDDSDSTSESEGESEGDEDEDE